MTNPATRRVIRQARWIALKMGLLCLLLLWGAKAHAGEPRSVLREPDRVYGVVAGEADASATVQNAANLGYLRGWNLVLDAAAFSRESGRRGSGAGLFFALPLLQESFALGAGVQGLWRLQSPEAIEAFVADEPYAKLNLALSVPLLRWLSGVSLGLSYGRFFSPANLAVDGLNQLDVGLSWWTSRFLALAVVLRGINQPRLGGADSKDGGGRTVMEFDPEMALRPLGTPNFELAVGFRAHPFGRNQSDEIRGIPLPVQFRGRSSVALGGIRIFAEAEQIGFQSQLNAMTHPQDAVRISAGVEFVGPRFGLAAAGGFGAPSDVVGNAIQGGAARLRLSQSRYRNALPVRARRVTRFKVRKFGGDRGLAKLIEELERLPEFGPGTVLLETEGMGYGFAQVEELREAVLRFRARGGKVAVYLNGGSLKTYFLAATADRIYTHPHTELKITGLSGRTMYYGPLLEKLGAKSEFLRIAEYKGAAEIYSSKTASDPVKEDRIRRFTDVWNHVLRMTARDRGLEPKQIAEWIDAAPHQPEEAKRLGIVDELAWPDEMDKALEAWLGKKVRVESLPSLKMHREDYGALPHIAVLHVNGDIVTGPSLHIPIIGRSMTGSDTIIQELRRLRKSPTVRAIVLRVNSPGGMDRAATAISRELDLTAKEKPLVISFSNVAASAAYHIAASGSYIFADATTFTGSIGIFLPKFDLSGTLEKFGIGADITGYGRNATMNSWFKPYSESEREAAMQGIQASYDHFVERVAKARGMSVQEVQSLAGGRVWSGTRALENGLVDAYGGLYEAVARARRMAQMRSSEKTIIHYPKPPGTLEQIRRLFGISIDLPIGGAGSTISDLRWKAFESALQSHPVVRILSKLPVSLWWINQPEALALDFAADGFVEDETTF